MTGHRAILALVARAFRLAGRPFAGCWRRGSQSCLLTIAFVGVVAVGDWFGDGQSSPTDRLTGHAQVGGTPVAGVIKGLPSVIDGDTLNVDGRRIRLYGIDAPKWSQVCRNEWGRDYRCGQSATLALAGYLRRDAVACEVRGIEHDGSVVAVCRRGRDDVNGWLVAQGWAVTRGNDSLAYTIREVAARVTGRGLWAGDFAAPSDWLAASQESRVSLR